AVLPTLPYARQLAIDEQTTGDVTRRTRGEEQLTERGALGDRRPVELQDGIVGRDESYAGDRRRVAQPAYIGSEDETLFAADLHRDHVTCDLPPRLVRIARADARPPREALRRARAEPPDEPAREPETRQFDGRVGTINGDDPDLARVPADEVAT